MLSLLRGDKLADDITMTGTVNPDGTIGPVGGIPYKVQGVIAAKKKRMLIPTGELNSANDANKLVRRVGEANLDAFETVVIAPQADQLNISESSAKRSFETADLNYGLSVSGLGVMGALNKYFGAAASSDYAELGGALALYNRTSALIAKYYSLGEVDPNTLDVTGISNDAAFQAAIALAQSQLAGGVGLLQSKQVNPTLAVADNEIAGVDREGEASDKLDALTEYWDGFLQSRVLAYLGGFASGT